MSFYVDISESAVYDSCPIVLIDTSGSTENIMKNNNKIIQNELMYAKNILKSKNIDEFHLILWSTYATYQKFKTENLAIENIKCEYCATRIQPALEIIINQNLLNKYKRVNDILIFTDGQVSNNDLTKEFKKIFNEKYKVNMYIYTIENNNNDYNKNPNSAGSVLYSMLKNQRLTHNIKKFECYNNIFIDDSYVTMRNLDVPEGVVPFREKGFFLRDLNLFIEDIYKDVQKETDEHILRKLMYDLAISINKILEYKPPHLKRGIINCFSSMFKDTILKNEASEFFDAQIDDINNGMTSTFAEYITNRNNLFDRASSSLIENGTKCFKTDSYVSATCGDNKKYIIETNFADSDVQIKDDLYKNVGISCNTSRIPLFPAEYPNEEFSRQCTRQWIRAVWANMYNRNANDDFILYMFLTDVLLIFTSDLPETIKKSYKDLGRVMLDRRRFGSGGVKEFEYLMKGNEPMCVADVPSKITDILRECSALSGLNVKPYTLWAGIVSVYSELKNSQKGYCLKDLKKDNADFNSILQNIKDRNGTSFSVITKKISDKNLEYSCPITLESTAKTGGYIIKPHYLGKFRCSPKYVFDSDVIKDSNKCVICNSEIEYNVVPPKSDKILVEGDESVVKNNTYSKNVKVLRSKQINIEDNELIRIDQLDLTNGPYSIEIPHLKNRTDGNNINVTDLGSFKDRIKKYDRLFNLFDWTCMCVAGGFCRSILMNQPVKDIDVFFFGINEKTMTMKIENLIKQIKKRFNNNLFMYKTKYNVFEIVIKDDIMIRVQLILRKHKNLLSTLKRFDMAPCRVAYTGKDLLFTDSAYIAYKFGVNIIDEDNYSKPFVDRIVKYFNSGFKICLPNLDLKKIDSKNILMFDGEMEISIDSINDNTVVVNSITSNGANSGDSSYTSMYNVIDMFDSIDNTVKAIIKENKKSYDSDDINKIYFSTDPIISNNGVQFENGTAMISIDNEFSNFLIGFDAYGKYRKD